MSTINSVSNMRDAAMPSAKAGAGKPLTPQQKISNMFDQMDSSGSGRVTKAQFQQAFNQLNTPASVKAMGADAVFSKLDPAGTGGVSKQDFIKGMESIIAQSQSSEAAPKAATTTTPAVAAAKPQAPSPTPATSPANSAPAAPMNVASIGGGPVGNTINVTA